MARISFDGVRLVKNFEGLRTFKYRDAVGVWTIGYGHTHGPKGNVDHWHPDWTTLLGQDLQRFVNCVQSSVARSATQDQFDAMVSFAYNVGCGSADPRRGFKGSALLRKFNDGDIDGAALEFRRWSKGTINGVRVVLRGLARRRAVEEAMFRGEDWEAKFNEVFKRGWVAPQ